MMSELTDTTAGMPKAAYIELTDRCNLACSMCRSPGRKGTVLPLPAFMVIAEELFPHLTFADLRGWGESTLLPNLFEYIDTALYYCPFVKLITNGIVERQGLWEGLGKRGVLMGFSIDAAEPALFGRLRGGASLDCVMRNLDRFVGGCIDGGHDPRHKVNFCITVSQENIAVLTDIFLLGHAHGVTWFKLEPITLPPGDPRLLGACPELVRKFLPVIQGVAWDLGVRVDLSTALLPEFVVPSAVNKLCIHPWTYVYVSSKGGIGFCDHLNGRDEYTFSSIYGEGSFMDKWNANWVRELRRQHLQLLATGTSITCCTECDECYRSRYVDLEYLVDQSQARFLVKL